MATMNVSLPEAMKDWVNGQTESGRYANASDYIRDLIRHDQERARALAELQARIDEGLDSGPGTRSMRDLRAAARARRAGNDGSDAI